jgi:hypothetical protein
MLKTYPLDIPPVIDFEWTKYNGAVSNPTADDLYGWVVPFEDETGIVPMIYTAPGYWNQYGSKSAFWTKYPLWQAQYSVVNPSPMLPWGDCDLWQWTPTGDGKVYGFPADGEKEADLSYFNGTLEDFYEFCGKDDTAPEPEPTPEPKPTYTDLYYVNALNWPLTHPGQKKPAAGGPLTQPLTSKPGKSDNRVTLLKPWQDYIAHWNTPQDTARIFSKDFGPTFGFNANGLIYLGLAYPGPVAVTPRPNLVRVLAISGAWAKIDSLTTAQMPGANVTPQSYPWLFHTVYGSANNSGGYSVLNHTYTIPLICAAGLPWWIPTAILTKA